MIYVSFEHNHKTLRFSDMGKTVKKKKTKKLGDKATDKTMPQEPNKAADEDKTFDFGGLPNRDLKKNLGCGS